MRYKILGFSGLLAAILVLAKIAFVSQPEIVGSWLLAEVNGSPPGTLHIETYRATFLKDGTWSFEAKMKDPFAGLEMKGKGRWSIKDHRLVWTAGANSGESTFSCDGRTLTLDPDPSVTPNGGRLEARTLYRRSSAP